MADKFDGIDAVDLFCGGGGLTCGLRQAGVDVRLGIDSDERCQYAYEHNNNAKFLHKSVTDVSPEEILGNFRRGRVSLLAGCAPCQTFSKYNQKATWRDKRWLLLDQFTRLVRETRPGLVTMENVPKLEGQKVFSRFTDALRDLGYHVCHEVVEYPKYDRPQLRERPEILSKQPAHFADHHSLPSSRILLPCIDKSKKGKVMIFPPPNDSTTSTIERV